MMTSKRIVCKIGYFCLLLLFANTLMAEVYWLTPRGGFGKPEGTRLAELADSKHLMTEPIIFNGVKSEINVSVIQRSLADLLIELKANYPDLQIKLGSDGVLLKLPALKGQRERILLVGSEILSNVTVFSMLLPEELPPPPPWPEELPVPPNATAEEMIYFENSKVWYGAFTDPAKTSESYESVKASLLQSGFLPLPGQADSNGETFMNSDKKVMVYISTDGEGNNVVIYTPLAEL